MFEAFCDIGNFKKDLKLYHSLVEMFYRLSVSKFSESFRKSYKQYNQVGLLNLLIEKSNVDSFSGHFLEFGKIFYFLLHFESQMNFIWDFEVTFLKAK